jgi:Na+/H+ antiporter NhaD/arsenite permease-like protein
MCKRPILCTSSPAIALADSAVITLLGEDNQDKYSSQRMFGSIGWATAMFIIGMVLDHSKIFQVTVKF